MRSAWHPSARNSPRIFTVTFAFLMVLAGTSCSRGKADLLRAESLEKSGKWEAAVPIYTHAASEIRASKRAELAEIDSRIGHCLIELGRGTDALVSLQRALTLDAGNVNAHLRMAQLFVAAGDPERAASDIAYVMIARPEDPEALQVRASAEAAAANYDLAERDLKHAYELSSDRGRVAEQLSQLYLSQDKTDQARATLVDARKRNPRDSHLLLTLARLDEIEGATDSAEEEYRKAAALDGVAENNERLAQFLARNGRITEAETVLHRVDAMRPESPVAEADLELVSAHEIEARQTYQRTLDRIGTTQSSSGNSGSSPIPLRPLTVRLIESDVALASSGDHAALADARQHLQQAKSLDPSTRALLQAEIDLIAGDLPAAEQAAKSAATDGNTAPAEYLIGLIAAMRGQEHEAATQWQAALDADPAYVPARLALANEAIRQRDGTRAEEYLVDVVRDEPANLQAVVLYARALLLQKRFDSARALARRAAAVNPKNAQVSMLLGDIALEQHQLALALLEYEKAMLLEPSSEQAIEGLTLVYEKGDADLALLRKLERMAQSGTPSSRLMEIAGRLYAWRHRYTDAARCLRRATEMDPSRTSATLALAGVYVDRDPNGGARELYFNPETGTTTTIHSNETPLFAALRAAHQGDQTEAIRQYETAIRLGDPSGVASNNLAWIYAAEGKHLDRAWTLAQHALEANPGSPQVLDTLGMIQFENRQFTQAIEFFGRGVHRASEMEGAGELKRVIEAHLAAALEVAGGGSVQTGTALETSR